MVRTAVLMSETPFFDNLVVEVVNNEHLERDLSPTDSMLAFVNPRVEAAPRYPDKDVLALLEGWYGPVRHEVDVPTGSIPVIEPTEVTTAKERRPVRKRTPQRPSA